MYKQEMKMHYRFFCSKPQKEKNLQLSLFSPVTHFFIYLTAIFPRHGLHFNIQLFSSLFLSLAEARKLDRAIYLLSCIEKARVLLTTAQI